jgi:hypothetical protein
MARPPVAGGWNEAGARLGCRRRQRAGVDVTGRFVEASHVTAGAASIGAVVFNCQPAR